MQGRCRKQSFVDLLDQDDMDVGELQLSRYHLCKRADHQLRSSEEHGDCCLAQASALGSSKAYDSEKSACRKSSRR